ncbi:TIGR00730 family Rossman fold protein [Flavobacteriaceae bacterium F08102]|nr:TIGR00730 family Rossman fold protein [Flavobacteriaceae bacterium F08102]
MKSIAVFCGSSTGFNPIYAEAARALGRFLTAKEIALVYGGGKIGLMGILADEILSLNGTVTGVIPSLLEHREIIHTDTTEMLITETMSERKIIMSKKVDGYIIMAGGFGTFDELFEVLTLRQLGIENKPIGILNTNGFYDALRLQLDFMVKEGFLKKEHKNRVLVGETISELFLKMEQYSAPTLNIK